MKLHSELSLVFSQEVPIPLHVTSRAQLERLVTYSNLLNCYGKSKEWNMLAY